MDLLRKWETYQKWVVDIKREITKAHWEGSPEVRDCLCMTRVPHMKIIRKENQYYISVASRWCNWPGAMNKDWKILDKIQSGWANIKIAEDQLPAARWFVLVGAWCREWNFHLKALIDLEKNTRATELEISVRGLEEIVYNQLKPEYDERKGDVPREASEGRILVVSNLPQGVKEADLKDKFRKYGRITGIRKMEEGVLIEYDDYRNAEDAQRELHGTSLNEQRIKIEFSQASRKLSHETST